MTINEQIGTQVVEWFSLEKNPQGRYDTKFGDKTLEGLGATMKRIIEDSEELHRRNTLGELSPEPKG